MPSKDDMISNINELADLDLILYESYQVAEKETNELTMPFNFSVSNNEVYAAIRKNHKGYAAYYPTITRYFASFLLVLTVVCLIFVFNFSISSFVDVVLRVLIVICSVFTFSLISLREKFIKLLHQQILGRKNISENKFGSELLFIRTYKFSDIYSDKIANKLSLKQLDKLIELVKISVKKNTESQNIFLKIIKYFFVSLTFLLGILGFEKGQILDGIGWLTNLQIDKIEIISTVILIVFFITLLFPVIYILTEKFINKFTSRQRYLDALIILKAIYKE
jgi:hypothetical protein